MEDETTYHRNRSCQPPKEQTHEEIIREIAIRIMDGKTANRWFVMSNYCAIKASMEALGAEEKDFDYLNLIFDFAKESI